MSAVRTPEEAAIRLLALVAVSGVAQGVDRTEVVDWLVREHLWDQLTPSEARFLEAPDPSERDFVAFSWRMECVYVLGWALMIHDRLSPPTEQAGIGPILESVPAPGESTAEFIRHSQLRDAGTIHLAAEEYTDMHARARYTPGAASRDIEVIQERHLALNWLIRYEELAWDHVTTDA
jgi:hypothetical protein